VFARPEELPAQVLGTRSGAGAAPVLLVCPTVDDAALRAAARIGAVDVVAWGRSTDELVATVAGLVRGDPSRTAVPEVGQDPLRELTHRELQIAQLIGRGATNVGIAESLGISYHTARTHVGRLMAKLQVTHRYAVVPLVQRSERVRRLTETYAGAAAR
jgi:DNA-binding NarL/FixJ family response regulator